MSQKLNDFLAREAGDYLLRMQRLLTGTATPDPAELSRLARGVRGSAQMAGAVDVAEVAERLEEATGLLARGQVEWDEGTRERLLRWVADLEALLYGGDSDILPISDLFYDDEGPHIVAVPAPPPESELEVVPIEHLLYAGEAALAAAWELRSEVQGVVADGDRTRALNLLDELFDLIRLAGSTTT